MNVPLSYTSVLLIALSSSAFAQNAQDSSSPAPGSGSVLDYSSRAGDLLGKTVINTEQEEIGEIDDLLIDKNKQIVHAVVSVGGVLGLGEKLVTVPFDQLQITYEDGELQIRQDATAEQLENAAEFTYKAGELSWPERMANLEKQREQRRRMEHQKQAEAIDLATWDQAELYKGWRANQMIGVEVRGKSGDVIGEVENIIVGDDGSVEEIIIEVGGVLGIGASHLAVNWDQVTVDENLAYVQVPVAQDSVDQFSLFDDDNEVKPRPGAFRVTKFMNDFVSLKDGVSYGVVDDLIFNREGEIKAVVVSTAAQGLPQGPIAYPYQGYKDRYDSARDTYQIPYERSEIMNLKPFDYEALHRSSAQK